MRRTTERTRTLSLTLVNDFSEIARLSKEVEAFGERVELPPQLVFQLNLALEEIVTNVISYGFDDDREHEIGVTLRFDGESVSARVEDDGIAYDPLAAPPPDTEAALDERRIGGLGVHLCKNMMDSMSYARRRGKNLLVMTKNVRD